MKKILLIEDDEMMQKLVKHSLEGDFAVLACATLAEAHEALDSNSDLAALIIDRSLPDGDGLSICSRVRREPRLQALPVIFLSGAGAETDKVGAFFAGADDYVTKPFGPLELKARLHARLRNGSQKIVVARLEIDINAQRAFHSDPSQPREIELTRTEFKILITLAQAPDQVFNRESLLARVWGPGCNVTDRVVDSHISHLRKKVAATGILIESLRGEGYRLALAQAPSLARAS